MPPTSRRPDHVEFLARGLIVCRGYVLVCWSRKGDYGYLPGGHIEVDEPAGEALVREMMEECGLKCRVGPLLLVHENRFVAGRKAHHELNLVFAAEIVDRAFRRAEDRVCHVAQLQESLISGRNRGVSEQLRFKKPIAPPPVESLESHLEFRWLTAAVLRKATVYPQPMAAWAAAVVAGGLESTTGLRPVGALAAEWLSTMG